MARPTTPFSIEHSPQLPELLAELDCSLALTTHQAGKLILLSSDGERLVQLPRTFEEPMGLAVDGDRMAVATRHAVVLLANDPRLATAHPRQPGTYDALFVPRAAHFVGALAVHDLAWAASGLVGVATLFSCLFELADGHGLRPTWRPPFVSALAPEDRCHLNGVAVAGGAPRYVSALGASDVREGWRAGKERGGVIVDVVTGEIALAELAMPHSPRVLDGRLHALLSVTGEVIAVEPEAGRYEVVNRVPGFARGLARRGDYLFVATSRLRKGHTFGDLPWAAAGESLCGVTVLHLGTGAVVADLRYLRSCEEIYDVQVLPGLRRPGVLGLHDATHQQALTLPEGVWWARAAEQAEE